MRSGLGAWWWGSRAVAGAADGVIRGEGSYLQSHRCGEGWRAEGTANPGDLALLGLTMQLAQGKGMSRGL